MQKRNEISAVVDYVFPLLEKIATSGLISDRLEAIKIMLSHAERTAATLDDRPTGEQAMTGRRMGKPKVVEPMGEQS